MYASAVTVGFMGSSHHAWSRGEIHVDHMKDTRRKSCVVWTAVAREIQLDALTTGLQKRGLQEAIDFLSRVIYSVAILDAPYPLSKNEMPLHLVQPLRGCHVFPCILCSASGLDDHCH